MKSKILILLPLLLLSSCAQRITKVEALPEHECVDLGLSVKWAKYNMGANKPEERGQYFQWGLKGTNVMQEKLDLYNDMIVNYKFELNEKNDIASILWDNGWRIPTAAEFKELQDMCTWEWAEVNGVAGQEITGPNGNKIFLPFAGIGDVQWGAIYTDQGFYWSSSTAENGESECLQFDLSVKKMQGKERTERLSIRAVKP